VSVIRYVSASASPSPMAMTAPVSRQLIGPGGGAVEGTVDAAPAPGPGSLLDGVMADHEQRISQLEQGGAGEAS
jgi:hypothetical protein